MRLSYHNVVPCQFYEKYNINSGIANKILTPKYKYSVVQFCSQSDYVLYYMLMMVAKVLDDMRDTFH